MVRISFFFFRTFDAIAFLGTSVLITKRSQNYANRVFKSYGFQSEVNVLLQ